MNNSEDLFSHVRSLGVVNPGLVWLLLTIEDGGPMSLSSTCLRCPSNVDTRSLCWTGKGKGQEQKAHPADSVPLLFKEVSRKFYLSELLLYHLAFFFFFLQDGYFVPDTVPNIHMYCIHSS